MARLILPLAVCYGGIVSAVLRQTHLSLAGQGSTNFLRGHNLGDTAFIGILPNGGRAAKDFILYYFSLAAVQKTSPQITALLAEGCFF